MEPEGPVTPCFLDPHSQPGPLQPSCRVELPTETAQTGLVFKDIRLGRGKAVVISRVAPHLEEGEGLRVGQQLLEMSDPVRLGERWELNDRVSLRFVKDAIRMQRGASIEFVLSAEPIPDAAEADWQAAAAAAQPAAAATSSFDEAAASGASFDEADFLGRIASEGAAPPGTIAERLAAQYAARQAEDGRLTALERRIKARQAYMEEADARDDAPFFAALAAAFLLPALVILGVAASSGYLDKLASMY